MLKIRQNIIFRFVWAFMALHLLNICIDAPDPQPANIAEDLSYNDRESIVEVILEDILQIEDAIAERDDADTDDNYGGIIKKVIELYCQNNVSPSLPDPITVTFTKPADHLFYAQPFHPLGYFEIFSPPPEV